MYALSPKVYIFDEPSANLDYAAAQRLAKTMKGLKEAGCTILVVEHRFYYLRELLDRAFLIQDGRIVQCFTPAQFCQLPEEARIQYGLLTLNELRDDTGQPRWCPRLGISCRCATWHLGMRKG